jgi:hypothetical protein
LAGLDNVDPANLCVLLLCVLPAFLDVFSCHVLLRYVGSRIDRTLARAGLRMMAGRVFDPTALLHRANQTREFPVIEEYAFHRNTAVAVKVRVLTS